RSIYKSGNEQAVEQLNELLAPTRFGGKESRLIKREDIDAAKAALEQNLPKIHALAATLPPEQARQVYQLSDELLRTFRIEVSGPGLHEPEPMREGVHEPESAHEGQPTRELSVDDVKRMLRRPTAEELRDKALRPDLDGHLANSRHNERGPPPE